MLVPVTYLGQMVCRCPCYPVTDGFVLTQRVTIFDYVHSASNRSYHHLGWIRC